MTGGTSDFDGDGIVDANDPCAGLTRPVALGARCARSRSPTAMVTAFPTARTRARQWRPRADARRRHRRPPVIVNPGPGPAPGGGVTPVAKAEFRLTFAFSSATSKATKFSSLVLRDLSAGTTVVVTCKGKRCPKGLKGKGFTKKNASGNVSLKTFIKKALAGRHRDQGRGHEGGRDDGHARR